MSSFTPFSYAHQLKQLHTKNEFMVQDFRNITSYWQYKGKEELTLHRLILNSCET
jgi:hypothetical protein